MRVHYAPSDTRRVELEATGPLASRFVVASGGKARRSPCPARQVPLPVTVKRQANNEMNAWHEVVNRTRTRINHKSKIHISDDLLHIANKASGMVQNTIIIVIDIFTPSTAGHHQ